MCTSTNGLFIMLQHYFRFSISWMYLYTVGLLTPIRFSAPRRLCVPAPTCEILLFLIGGAAGIAAGNGFILIHLLYSLPCCQAELLPAPAALYVRTLQAYHSRWSWLPCRAAHFQSASDRYRCNPALCSPASRTAFFQRRMDFPVCGISFRRSS